MTFKLRIRGRDYFEPSTAANPANPLILTEQKAGLPTVSANDATAQDLTVEDEIIMVGGITAAQVEYIADPNAVETPDAPVVYEDDAPEANDEDSASSTANLDDAVEAQ